MPKDKASLSAADLDAMFPEDTGQSGAETGAVTPGVSAAELDQMFPMDSASLDAMFPEDGAPPAPEPPTGPVRVDAQGIPITEGPPILEGVGLSFAKGLTADIGSSIAGMHEALRRAGAGVVGKLVGPRAEQAVYTAIGYTPQHLLWNTLDDHVFDPLGAYWQEGKLEDLQRAVQGRGVLDMWRSGDLLGYGLRGFAANGPQLGVSMLTGSAVARAGTGLAAKVLGLALPVAMETGETVAGLEAQEEQTGEKIDNLRFGGVALAKGLVAGSLEAIGAGALLGKAAKAFPVLAGAKGGLQFLGEVAAESGTEGAQTFIGNVAEDLALRPPETLADYTSRWLDPTFRAQMMEDVGPSAFLGSFSAVAVGPFTTDWGRAPEATRELPADAEEARSVAARERRRLVPGKIDETLPMSDAVTVRSYLESQFTNLDADQKSAVFDVLERQVDAVANVTGLDRGHIWGRFLTDQTQGPTPPVKRLYQAAERGQLVVAHNMYEEGIALFEQLGGRVPGLSFAVLKPEHSREGGVLPLFGPITLIARPEAIDPQLTDTEVYDDDFSSAVMPEEVTRDENGILRDGQGAPLTPESLAALYGRERFGDVESQMERVGFGLRQLRSLDEIKTHGRKVLRGPTAFRESQDQWVSFAERKAQVGKTLGEGMDAAGLWPAMQRFFADSPVLGGQPRDAYTRHFAEEVVDTGRAIAARVKSGMPLAEATRREVSLPWSYLERVPELAWLRAELEAEAVRYAEELLVDPRRYFEAKRWSATEASDFMGVVVDSTRVSADGRARLRALAEQFGWDYREAAGTDYEDARHELVFQFSDRFFQRSGNAIKGQTSVLPDGRVLIEAFQAHDVSTAIHELAHGWRQTLYWAESMASGHERKKLQAGLKTLEEWAGVKNGRWTKAAEEKWARATEQYLLTGKAPVASLKRLFEQFKQWLGAVYSAARARRLPTFTPEVAKFFDAYVLDVRDPADMPGMPDRIDKKAWRKEDRQAVALARNLRNLEPQRARFVEEVSRLEKLRDKAQQNALVTDALKHAKTQADLYAEAVELGHAEADAQTAKATTLVQEVLAFIDAVEQGTPRGVPVSADIAEELVLKVLRGEVKAGEFVTRYWQRLSAIPGGAEKLTELRPRLIELHQFLTTARDLLKGVKKAQIDLAGWSRMVESGQLVVATRKLVFRQGIQYVRELKEIALPDVVAEGDEVRRITDRLWNEPNLIRRYIADATAAIQRKADEINQATLLYKAVTRKIAVRGLPPETWSASPEDWSIFEKAELEAIQEEVRNEVAAAKLEIEATDPTAFATEGVVLDISSIMNTLGDVLHRGVEQGRAELPSTISPDITAAVGVDFLTETSKLFDGGQDQVIEKMQESLRTPIQVVRDTWKALAESVRDHTDMQFRTGQTLTPFGKPVHAFNPRRFDQSTMVGKLSAKMGLRWRQSQYQPEQMPKVEQAFADASGKVDYFESVVSPRTREAFYQLLPDLPARQLVSIVRDFSGVEIRKIKEKFVQRTAEAEAKYARLLTEVQALSPRERLDRAAELKAAEKEVNVWRWRTSRLDGHKTLQRMEMAPRVAYVLKAIGATYDAFFLTAASNQLIGSTALLEDYLNRIYRKKDLDAAREFFKDRLPLDKKNPHSFHRVFDTMIEAHAFGLTPATLDIAELVDSYARSLVTSVAKKQLVDELMAVAPQAFRWDRPRTAGASARDAKVQIKDGPKGPVFLDLSRYVSHSTQASVRPDPEAVLYAEEHIWNLFHNLYEVSAFDVNPILHMVKKVNAWLKRIQLAIDLYHFFQITRMAMSLGHIGAANARIGKLRTPFIPYQLAIDALGMTDPTHPQHPVVRQLIEQGLQMSSGDWARRKLHEYLEVTVGKAVLPGLYHKLGHNIEAFSRILWEEYVPGLKVMVAVQQLDRLQRNPKTKDLPQEQLVKAAVTFTNDVFGGMAWRTHGRSKTQQDLLKILFLAPDWLETRFRTVTGLVKDGPEKELWFEYWFGGAGMRLKQKAEAALKNDPSLVSGGPIRWSTGYLLQGMAFTAFANAVIWGAFAAGAGEDDDDYPKGMEWFTSIVMPTADRRGAPLKISLFSTVDYITAFLMDIPSISVLVSYWSGRQGPILRAAREVVLGRDFAGRPMRPYTVSTDFPFVAPEFIISIAQNAMPWFNNILYGSATEPFFQDKWEFYAVRNISRTMGGHTTSSYPRQMQEEYDFLIAQTRSWNSYGKKLIERMLELPPPLRWGVLGYARAHAAHHNRRVRGLLERVRNDEILRKQFGKRLVADKKALMMWSP